jgi:hypothetical protein
MYKKVLLVFVFFVLVVLPAQAQYVPPNGGGGNAMATYLTENQELTLANSAQLLAGTNITLTPGAGTLTVSSSGGSASAGGTNGQIQFNSSGPLGGFTLSGDGTLNTSTGAITITKTNGTAFSTAATTALGSFGAVIPLLNGNNVYSGTANFIGTSPLLALRNTSAPTAQSGALFQGVQANGTAARLELDAYGSQAFFTGVAYGGTQASPTALTTGTQITGFNAFGYNGTAVVGSAGTLRTYAADNWAVGDQGTYIDIAVTKNGTNSAVESIRFENDGGITVPSTVTGGDQGVGTINCAGIYVNGIAVTGGGGSGTVTSASVVSANGLAGTVATATTTPAITLSTTVTGVLKGNGTAISAATAGTDYQVPITLTTTGTSGAATFSGGTLNIPQYSGGGGSVSITAGNTGIVVSPSPITGTGTVSLGNPSASTLGGIESYTAVTNQWINAISTSGVPSSTQPAFSNLSGSATLAQFPTIANNTVLGNVSGSTAVPTATSAPVVTSITAPVSVQTITTDTDGATITFNLATSNWHNVVLGGNRTLALSNATVGQQFTIQLTQPASGGPDTVTWFSGITWNGGGGAPTLQTANNAVDTITFKCTGSGAYIGYPTLQTSYSNITATTATVTHQIAQGTAPTVAVGAGAGTGSPSATISGHDTDFSVTLTSGTVAATGVIFTTTFGTAYTSAPYIQVTPGNANAAALMTAILAPYASSTNTTMVLNSGSTGITAAGAVYIWYVHCGQ